jgi:hypothetical protein
MILSNANLGKIRIILGNLLIAKTSSRIKPVFLIAELAIASVYFCKNPPEKLFKLNLYSKVVVGLE